MDRVQPISTGRCGVGRGCALLGQPSQPLDGVRDQREQAHRQRQRLNECAQAICPLTSLTSCAQTRTAPECLARLLPGRSTTMSRLRDRLARPPTAIPPTCEARGAHAPVLARALWPGLLAGGLAGQHCGSMGCKVAVARARPSLAFTSIDPADVRLVGPSAGATTRSDLS